MQIKRLNKLKNTSDNLCVTKMGIVFPFFLLHYVSLTTAQLNPLECMTLGKTLH